MARVKGAMMTRKRRNKVLKAAKGYWGAKSKHFKVAKEQVMKSGNYACTVSRKRGSTSTARCLRSWRFPTRRLSPPCAQAQKRLSELKNPDKCRVFVYFGDPLQGASPLTKPGNEGKA